MKNYNSKETILKQLDFKRFYADYGYFLNSKNTSVKCCFHDDKTPSMSINSENGMFKCFACGKSGNIFDWYILKHGVNFKEAVRQIADKYNTTAELLKSNKNKKQDLKKDQITVELVEKCHQDLPIEIRNYLNHRGIPDHLIEKYKLGWGKFHNKYWITIPLKNKEGKYVSFKLRRAPNEDSPEIKTPKYIFYPKNSGAELFDYETLKGAKEVFICEGEFDKLVLEAKELSVVTSTAGAKTFKAEWLEHFKDKEKITVCYDNDTAGGEGADKLIEALLKHTSAKVFRIDIPEMKGEQ